MTGTKNFRERSVAKRLEKKLALNLYMMIIKTTIIEILALLTVEILN